MLHYDSDILQYQSLDSDWIRKGKDLINALPEVMFVAPLPGPPTASGELKGQKEQPVRDEAGNFMFKSFSSRRFLVNKTKLEHLLPCPALYTSPIRKMLMKFGVGNALLPWESSMSAALSRSKYFRLHLCDKDAWTLHCPDHGPEWVTALPSLIARIETGDFPAEQAGTYDLHLPYWK